MALDNYRSLVRSRHPVSPASFARRLSMPVNNDTLLRSVRKRGGPSFAPPAIIAIDDRAWRRNLVGWSNGQTKGQIRKLKLVKRLMCGRGKLDLLQARAIDAA